jgi:hypothetical protein
MPTSNFPSKENPQFDQQEFKMIAHIAQYFHPLGAADSLGYIFQLIDIKQSANEPFITLKAGFSCLFALLKIGGINIEPPLQESGFISYCPVVNRRVRMGINSFAPIFGTGSAVIAVNGKCILIRYCLHVLALRNPLYSLRAH